MDLETNTQPSIPGLSKEQRIGFVLLLIFGIISVLLGVLQIRNRLYKPFALNNSVPGIFREELTGVDALRFRDTDNDGLKDFDELYSFGTSPYLYDTFNYGFSDREVIAKGLPLCPNGGKNCPEGMLAANADSLPRTSTSTSVGIEPPPSFDPNEFAALFSNPNELRKVLLQTGVTAEALSQINDEQLLTMAAQVLSSTSTILDIQKAAQGAADSSQKQTP